jgi:plasmid stabilization system protein ParE
MPYTVVFTPEAETQLTELYGYIAAEASPDIAARFTDGIVTYCESLTTLPLRGVKRDDRGFTGCSKIGFVQGTTFSRAVKGNQ